MRPAILITGGAKRVGAELSRYFAHKGYDIALHYNRSATQASALKTEIEAMGVSCELFTHDLADIKGLQSLCAKVAAAFPTCNALVNNASVFERSAFMETDEALYDRQWDINFKAPFFLSQHFARTFGKGAIINILDTDIVKTEGSHFAYLLSKKALAEFTVMAAKALGPDIRVGGVCPGCIFPSDQNDDSYEKKLEKLIPIRSHPTAKEVAEAAAWLIEQPHITGQLIFVDGGKHAI
jgi:pteridine reductase